MQYVPPLGATDPNTSYVEGDPTAGIRGSYPTAAGYEAMMREVCNAALLSGQTANPSDFTQTFQAMAAGGIWVGAFGYAASTTVGSTVTPETYSAALPAGGVIPTLTSLRVGTRLIGFVPTANATSSPVLVFTGVGSGPVTAAIGKRDATAPSIGDVAAALVAFRFDGTKWRLEGMVKSDVSASDSEIWHFGAAGGTATAMTTTLSPVPKTASSICIRLYMPFTNGASPTLDFGFGAKEIVANSSGEPLVGAEMSGFADLTWDGETVRLMNPVPGATSTVLSTYYGQSFSTTMSGGSFATGGNSVPTVVPLSAGSCNFGAVTGGNAFTVSRTGLYQIISTSNTSITTSGPANVSNQTIIFRNGAPIPGSTADNSYDAAGTITTITGASALLPLNEGDVLQIAGLSYGSQNYTSGSVNAGSFEIICLS